MITPAVDSFRIVPCEACGSEGRIYLRCMTYEPGCGHAHYHGERDDGECPVCEGTGSAVIQTEPVDMDDLIFANGDWRQEPSL